MAVKRQHYVPQFYLNEFVLPKKRGFHCFDKKSDNIFPSSVSRVAAESYFNDINKDQSFERALSKFEGMVSGPFKKLLEFKSLGKITPVDKAAIAYFIAAQHSRTRRVRDMIMDASEKVLEQAKELGIADDPRVSEMSFEEGAKRFQYHLMKITSTKFTKLLLTMKWVIIINQTEMPFWTSDSPLVHHNSLPHDKYDGQGFERLGSELYFPLNPWLLLAVIDERLYSEAPNKIAVDDVKEIVFYNHLQVLNSKRFIFSPYNDFSVAQDLLTASQDLKNVDGNYFDNEGVSLHQWLMEDHDL